MDPPSTNLPKPPVPYTKGWRFSIQPHTPLPPTPVTADCCRNFQSGREERSKLNPLARCLNHPPLPGKDVETESSYTVDLEIHDLLKVGDGHNAQVFTVQVPPEKKELVTKVYDPLYFDDEEGYLNPFYCMDKFYTHEVHTYDLLAEFQGSLIPRFYGSYSLNFPVDNGNPGETRTVRMILVEYIPGITMLQPRAAGNLNTFSQERRQKIMKSIIDFETRVYNQFNIILPDLSPRNVIMTNTEKLDSLVFIDFGSAVFNRKPDDPPARNLNVFLGQYISPLLRWKERTRAMDFVDWIDWDWTPWVQAEYAHTADTITPEMREAYSF